MPGPTQLVAITLHTNFAAQRFRIDPMDFIAMDATGQIVHIGQGFGRQVTGHIAPGCQIQVGWTEASNSIANPSRVRLQELTLTFQPKPGTGTTASSPFSDDPGQLSSPNGDNIWHNAGTISATGDSGQPLLQVGGGYPLLGPAMFIQTPLVTEGVWEFSIKLRMTDGSVNLELNHDPEMRVGEDPN